MREVTSNAEILTASESAELLRVSRAGFYQAVRKGGIPYYRLFGRKSLRFKRVEIEGLLEPVNGKEVDHAE